MPVAGDKEEVVQRAVDFNTPIRKRRRAAGERVRVYNRTRAAIQLTDCILPPEAEAEILRTDAEDPRVAPNVLHLA
jgi:hypothetical protein